MKSATLPKPANASVQHPDPIDPERAIRLTKAIVGPMMASGTKIGPFDREDFEGELLLYCYDNEEQRRHGNYVRQSDNDTHVRKVLKRRADDWRQWAYDTRTLSGPAGFSTANRDYAESDAFDKFANAKKRAEKDLWLLGEDAVDFEDRVNEAIDNLERSLRTLRGAVAPPSETQKAITRALCAESGESNLTDALRRCVAWAAWRLVKRGRSDDVRLMFRRFRHGEKITQAEKNRLTRDVVPDMAREMNRYLAGEREPDQDGPGSRKVRRPHLSDDGNYSMSLDDEHDPEDWGRLPDDLYG